jgi:hypothetical protein
VPVSKLAGTIEGNISKRRTEMSCDVKKITIDGVEYVRADSVLAAPIPGKRCVIVIDRGWIAAGDVTEKDGRILLTRALHIMGWDSIGYDGMIRDPKNIKVRLRPVPEGFDIPSDSEIFRTHVSDNWGL